MSGSVKKNFLYQSAYQVLLILAPLVTTPYLSRVLGAESVGVYSYTFALTNYFVMFATLGMSTYGVREIAKAGDDKTLRSKTFCSAYASQLIVSLIVTAVYACYIVFLEPRGGQLLACVWGLWVLSAVTDVSWLLFGVEEFRIPTIISTITKIVNVAMIFLFVHSPDDLWVYCMAVAGANFFNQLFVWPFVKRYVSFIRPTMSEVVVHIKPSLVLFIPVIAISLYTSMDKILLGAMAGMEQTGFFEYSEKLSKMPMAIITALGTVMLPRMTACLAAGNRDEALNLLAESVWVMLVMAFALAFGIAAIAPEFAPVFLGDEFAECAPLMAVLAIVIPIISLTNVIGRQYLVPIGKDKMFTLSVCVGSVVNIVANLALIPSLGAMGAAIATVAAEGAVLIAQAVIAKGELPLGSYIASSIPFVIIGLLMALAVRAAASWFNSLWGLTVHGLALEIIIGVFVYSLLAFAWCKASHDEHLDRLLHWR